MSRSQQPAPPEAESGTDPVPNSELERRFQSFIAARSEPAKSSTDPVPDKGHSHVAKRAGSRQPDKADQAPSPGQLSVEQRQKGVTPTGSRAISSPSLAGVSLDKALEDLSLASLPDARLVLHHACWPHDIPATVVRLGQGLNGNGAFGVVQPTNAVAFTLVLPIPAPAEHPDGQVEQGTSPRRHLSCEIIYDPARDSCVVKNRSQMSFDLGCIKPDSSQTRLDRSQVATISPGLWSVSLRDSEEGETIHIVDLLLLRRKFTIEAVSSRPPPPAVGSAFGKRKAIESDSSVPVKRPKPDGPEGIDETHIIIAPAPELLDAFPDNPSQSLDSQATQSIKSLVQLRDGMVVAIRTVTDNQVNYSLSRLSHVAVSGTAHLFTGQHSSLSNRIVAKVMRYERKYELSDLLKRARDWNVEYTCLKRLKHRNIISLEAADSRLFVLYLEHLPRSLQRDDREHFSFADAQTVMGDVTSALAYLKTQNMAHNDLKPANIAYSPERGAVLIDFGLASRATDYHAGGTPWYVPPDYLSSRSRGCPGDIWALGVTMLYVLGHTCLPERAAPSWMIVEVDSRDINAPATRQMAEWLENVDRLRRTALVRGHTRGRGLEAVASTSMASSGDSDDNSNNIAVVERLVARMLEVSPAARVTAAQVVAELADMHAQGGASQQRN